MLHRILSLALCLALSSCLAGGATPGDASSPMDTSGLDGAADAGTSDVDTVTPPGDPSGIRALQSSAASTDCVGSVPDQVITEDVTVTAVVTVARFPISAALHGYYLSDGTQEPYSGIQLTVSYDVDPPFFVGDVITVTGRHVEHRCMTQLGLGSWGVMAGTDLTPPAPLAILGGLPDGAMEQYEGMLVELRDVTVTAVTGFNEADTDAGVLIDGSTESIMGSALAAPPVGTTYATVRGIVRWAFSRYRVAPRSPADLVEAGRR